jgi:aspartyl-tRNA synthetase
MDTKEKINLLETAMQIKTRDNGQEFYCFTETVPEELKDLFISNYNVKDLDYQIFSTAIDTIVEAWANNEDSPTLLEEYIYDNYNDFASPYNADRLAYMDIHNEAEIVDIIKEYSCEYINEACAIWYDNQVKDAIMIILNRYILKD